MPVVMYRASRKRSTGRLTVAVNTRTRREIFHSVWQLFIALFAMTLVSRVYLFVASGDDIQSGPFLLVATKFEICFWFGEFLESRKFCISNYLETIWIEKVDRWGVESRYFVGGRCGHLNEMESLSISLSLCITWLLCDSWEKSLNERENPNKEISTQKIRRQPFIDLEQSHRSRKGRKEEKKTVQTEISVRIDYLIIFV